MDFHGLIDSFAGFLLALSALCPVDPMCFPAPAAPAAPAVRLPGDLAQTEHLMCSVGGCTAAGDVLGLDGPWGTGGAGDGKIGKIY